jgi:cation transport ATPase
MPSRKAAWIRTVTPVVFTKSTLGVGMRVPGGSLIWVKWGMRDMGATASITAGIILLKSNPLDIVRIVRLSQETYRKMIQNLIWATGYNVIALPLAAGVLAPVGIVLSPAVGALLMSLSTAIVAINAQLLRRANLNA